MYLRDIGVYADELIVERFPSGFVGWFHRETCCIAELYVNLLHRKIVTPDTAHVKLLFTDQQSSAPTVRQLLNVADAKWLFDFSAYAKLDEQEKKRSILDALYAALLWIAKERAWETEALKNSYAQVLDLNLAFERLSKKSWVSPNPKYRAKIGFCFGLRKVDFFVGIFDRKGREIGRKPLGSTAPEMGIAHLVLKGPGRWIAGNVFRLQIADSYLRLPKSWQVDLSDLLA